MFFEDRNDHFFPVAQVHGLRPIANQTGKTMLYPFRVELSDGDTTEVSQETAKAIMRAGCPTLPAQPGTYLLTFCDDKYSTPPEPFTWRVPIVGFQVELRGLFPLVMDTTFDEMRSNNAVLHPCGLVDGACEDQYATEAAWFAEQVRITNIERAREVGA